MLVVVSNESERIRIVAGSVDVAARHHSVVVRGDASCIAEIVSTKLATAGRGIGRREQDRANFLVNLVNVSRARVGTRERSRTQLAARPREREGQ